MLLILAINCNHKMIKLYQKTTDLGLRVFNATFNNFSVISWLSVFIGGGNWSTQRKPQTCRRSLTNLKHLVMYRI